MRHIGIDLGTSFIKGAVLDLDRLCVRGVKRASAPLALTGLPSLRTEFDPEGFVNATRRIIEELLSESPDCQGVLMCGQMGGLVLISPQGKALSNYISWLDRRLLEPHASASGSWYDALLSRLTPADWIDLGREIRPGTTLSYLLWLKETGGSTAVGAIAATLPDFVLARLCGTSPATHPTNAVGAVNIWTGDWHFSLFERLGLEHTRWPALREVDEPVGEVRIGGRRLTCYPPVGDHPCALVGALLDFEELSLNISTGSQVSLRSQHPEPGDYQTLPFFDGQFLHRISNLPAGRALNALVGLLGELAEAEGVTLHDPWDYIGRAAAAKTTSELRACLSFFPTPVGDSGSITNIREENLRVGNLFRAAFTNMAENYYSSALKLSSGQSWRRLVLSGGLPQRLEVLRNLIAEKFRCEYRLCSGAEDTLQGLLVLALVASGRSGSVQAAMELLGRAQPET